MARTRSNRDDADQADQADDADLPARSTRRAGEDTAAPLSKKARGKRVSVPSSIPDEEESEEGNDDVTEDDVVATGEPVARFGAPRGKPVRSISPPPQSESEMGSQSFMFTPRYTHPLSATDHYTRFSSVSRQPSTAPRSQEPPRNSQKEDDNEELDVSQEVSEEQSEWAEIRETALDSLWDTSRSLAKLLFSPKSTQGAWKFLLEIHRNNWYSIQRLFTDEGDDEILIDLPKVLQSFDERVHSHGRIVISLANATALQNELSKVLAGEIEPLPMLVRLDRDFPVPFMPYIPDDPHEVITKDHVALAVEARTQRLIAALKGEGENAKPAEAAARLFCDVEPSVIADEALRHGPYQKISFCDAEATAQRARDILPLVEDQPVAEAIAALEAAYPFNSADDDNDFCKKMTLFNLGLITSVKESTMSSSPASSVIESSPTNSLASSTPQHIVRRAMHENIMSRATVHHLAGLVRRPQPLHLSGSPSARPFRQSSVGFIMNLGDGADDQSLRHPSPAPSEATEQRVLALIRRNQQQRDKQHAAPEPSPGPSTARTSGFTAVNGPPKRPHDLSQSQGDDGDDEDPFEEDTREPDSQRRAQLDRDRLNMPPPPAKRQRLPSRPTPASSALVPPAGQPQRSVSASPTPSSLGGGIRHSQILEQNRRAPLRTPGVQQRVPWSDKDVERLIRLLDYHNCRWSVIAKRQSSEGRRGEEPGPEVLEDCLFDHPRDQQAIRDKARNIKVDFLKADLPLYPGFDNIRLGIKERNILTDRGKNPDRLVEDVDINGNPINTEYVPVGEPQ